MIDSPTATVCRVCGLPGYGTLCPVCAGQPCPPPPSNLGLDRTLEDWETDPAQDAALDAALAHDQGPATPRILAAIQAGTWTR